jgi:hypothetical protein
LARDWARELTGDLTRDLTRDWARDWALYGTRSLARNLARNLARAWARDYGLDPVPDWMLDFTLGELSAFGRYGFRAVMAWTDLPTGSPLRILLSKACHLSLDPGGDPAPFEASLAQQEPPLDPLWPALARHLARRSTEADRSLLADLAAHPERRDGPLSWGLRYIVRGDVLLDDGSVVTLDELADEVGLERLPYLEEMPEELDVDWGED